MGLSNFSTGQSGEEAPKYSLNDSLAGAVFGDNQAPPTAMPLQQEQPVQDSSIISMNAQPKQGGGGLEALLKLFAGG